MLCLASSLPAVDAIRSASEPDFPPLSMVNTTGQADGFAVDLLRAVLKAMGREVTFEIGTRSQIKRDLTHGKLDVLPLIVRAQERETPYEFTIPCLTLHGVLFIRKNATDIQTWSDLRNKRVAVMKGDAAEEYARRIQLSERILTYDSFAEAFERLSDGHADAVIAQKITGAHLLINLGITNVWVVGKPDSEFTQTFRFAVQENNKELLAVLNEGLAIVMANGVYRQLQHKWMGTNARENALTHVIVYGGDSAFPPYEFLDEKGRPSGFNIDLARAVARQLGASITFELGPWDDIRRRIENGEFDLASMFYSASREQHVDFTVPHTFVHQAVFARDDSPSYHHFDDLKGQRISVQSGDIMHDYALERGLGDTLTTTATPEEALALLARKQVDFAMGSHLQGLYWIKKNGWASLRSCDAHLLGTEYCYAVPKMNTELRDLVNDGLRQLKDNGEYRKIYNTWLGVLDPDVSRRWIIKIILLLLTAASILTAVAGGIIFILRRQVRKRTAELEETNAALEKAHSNALMLMQEEVQDKEKLQQTLVQAKQSRLALLTVLDDVKREAAERSRLSAAIEQSDEAVLTTDTEGNIQYVNPAFTVISGYSREETVGRNARFLKSGKQNAEFYQQMWARLRHGDVWRGHFINKRKDGTFYEEDASISPVRDGTHKIINYVAVKRDVTREIQLEAQFIQGQKMESVGRLAGGVAHDFNNLLMGILGYAELCRDQISASHPIRDWLDQITRTAQRSAEITRQLLAFARKQTIAPKVLNLNDAVANMLKLLQRLLGEDIDLVWLPDASLHPIKIDPSQIDQILANLCINARDAIVGVGKITLATQNSSIDEDFCVSHLEAIPGNYILLTVSDDGCGMDAETVAKMFEPFFTTKDVSNGTGLGLATVYGIVKQNNGFICATSEVGKGTVFKIFLPEVTTEIDISAVQSVKNDPKGQGETVLLAEDDPSLCKICQRFLEDLGYHVLVAGTAEEALNRTARNLDEIRLLLTDVVMPEMDGRQLANRITAIKPGIKTLFMSGYSADVIAERGVLEQNVAFIAKPFTRSELARKVYSILANSDEKPAEGGVPPVSETPVNITP